MSKSMGKLWEPMDNTHLIIILLWDKDTVNDLEWGAVTLLGRASFCSLGESCQVRKCAYWLLEICQKPLNG